MSEPVLSPDGIRTRLAGYEARELSPTPGEKRAAVAAVLRQAAAGPELLFIHRAEHPGDPWSGHMAFPGGRVEPADATPLAAAVRETREEIALDLDRHGSLLGRLSDLGAIGRGKPLAMVIVPFVFELHNQALTLAPNHEVQEIVWVPLRFLADYGNRKTMAWEYGDVQLPCYHYGKHLIWGLTLGMVDELLACLAA